MNIGLNRRQQETLTGYYPGRANCYSTTFGAGRGGGDACGNTEQSDRCASEEASGPGEAENTSATGTPRARRPNARNGLSMALGRGGPRSSTLDLPTDMHCVLGIMELRSVSTMVSEG
jgi:hypothetical protein